MVCNIIIFCLLIAHTCDITDDVERCAEMAGALPVGMWSGLCHRKEMKKISR